MTPQEQYLKFYEKPHLWINSIEVEVIQDSVNYGKGSVVQLTSDNLYSDGFKVYVPYCKPLFKPQEGEAFIKDLEDAVSKATFNGQVKCTRNSGHLKYFEINEGLVEISFDHRVHTNGSFSFDTAAYIDRLRELGYYI